MKRLILTATLVLAPLAANALTLAWPLDCKLGENCTIQNYAMHDSTPAPQNFACDSATLPGLTGTDIRLQSLADMRKGVAVRAAADGTIASIHDGAEDHTGHEANPFIPQPQPGAPGAAATAPAPAPAAKNDGDACGNSVSLTTADGYTIQYCHLRKGSVHVKPGQQVKSGDALALVGESGQSFFPHLSFDITKGAEHIDPFTSAPVSASCDADTIGTAPQLWATPIPYQFTTLVNDGVTDSYLTLDTAQDAVAKKPIVVPTNTPNLLYWAVLSNLKAGDKVTLTVTAPDGSAFGSHNAFVQQPKAQEFYFVGEKNCSLKLDKGVYKTRVQVIRKDDAFLEMLRKDETVLDITHTFTVQ